MDKKVYSILGSVLILLTIGIGLFNIEDLLVESPDFIIIYLISFITGSVCLLLGLGKFKINKISDSALCVLFIAALIGIITPSTLFIVGIIFKLEAMSILFLIIISVFLAASLIAMSFILLIFSIFSKQLNASPLWLKYGLIGIAMYIAFGLLLFILRLIPLIHIDFVWILIDNFYPGRIDLIIFLFSFFIAGALIGIGKTFIKNRL